MSYQVVEQAPSAEHFIQLRASLGWSNPAINIVKHSLANSLFWVSIYQEQQLAATGRIIGDNSMYFYIQDVIVAPDFQGLGLGTTVMSHIERYLAHHCQAGATVGLLAAHGKEAFYQKYGYGLRDGKSLGMALCKFI